MTHDTIVVGAGLAGLSCARALTAAGRSVVVLDKARGVGGRAATRRVEDQAIDHGLPYYHGRDPGFLEALRDTGAACIDGWPRRVDGAGHPCAPSALARGETRLAFAAGSSAFPKALARGLDVRTETAVRSIRADGAGFVCIDEAGGDWSAPTVLVTPPVPQTVALLGPLLETETRHDAVLRLLRSVGEVPCRTVIAGFGVGGRAPEWDAWFPEDSEILQLMSHDSSKRESARGLVVVLQARERWSRISPLEPRNAWVQTMLDEAGRLAGPWAARPDWLQSHVWRYARVPAAARMSSPLLLQFPVGTSLGIAGEAFAAEGGAQGAWRSGQALARRVLEGES